jgi:hypothetical protein
MKMGTDWPVNRLSHSLSDIQDLRVHTLAARQSTFKTPVGLQLELKKTPPLIAEGHIGTPVLRKSVTLEAYRTGIPIGTRAEGSGMACAHDKSHAAHHKSGAEQSAERDWFAGEEVPERDRHHVCVAGDPARRHSTEKINERAEPD